jgi:hypothetical protein
MTRKLENLLVGGYGMKEFGVDGFLLFMELVKRAELRSELEGFLYEVTISC